MTDILTDEQDALVAAIKNQFYYPNGGAIYETVKALAASQKPDEQANIFRLSVRQLNYEQSLRRRFVLDSLYANSDLLRLTAQENLVAKISTLSPGAYAPTPIVPEGEPAPQIIAAVSQEVIEQARIYQTVAVQLHQFTAASRLTPPVHALYRSLKRIALADLEQLRTTVQSFIAEIAKQEEAIFSFNPDLPAPMIVVLKKAGLDLPIGRYQTLGEKLNFLGVILIISSVISQAAQQQLQLTEEQELQSIGRIMDVQDINFVSGDL